MDFSNGSLILFAVLQIPLVQQHVVMSGMTSSRENGNGQHVFHLSREMQQERYVVLI